MYQVLELLRQADGFLSGEEIGKRLSISRAAVWKAIGKLREEGYQIEAVTKKGYRLHTPESLYNQQELQAGLHTVVMGQNIEFFAELDSTNNRARELALAGAQEGTLVVAEKQNAGRGRRGRAWTSEKGSGIWMSLLLRPEIPPEKASVLTLLAGLATAEALEAETGLPMEIKWPNDILCHGKKVVGILTEMDCEMTQVHFVIAGIGINVNTKSFPLELANVATSLYLESGKVFSRKQLVHAVLQKIEQRYQAFLDNGNSFSVLLEAYCSRCVTLHKQVRVLRDVPFTAYVLDITPEGELLVQKEDGTQEVVYSGEVSIRGV